MSVPHRMGLLLLLCCTLLGACRDDTPAPRPESPADQRPLQVLDLGQEPHEGRLAAVVRFSTAVDLSEPVDRWLDLQRHDGAPLGGGWISSEDRRTFHYPGLEPEQRYRLDVRPGLPASNGSRLAEGQSIAFTTADLPRALGFASRGNLLADRLSNGLPVISLNSPEAELDFYRVRPERLQAFLAQFGQRTQLDLWRARELLEHSELVYSARFDLEAPRNQRVTRYLPVQEIDALQPAGVYLAIMKTPGSLDYRLPATWFAVTDLSLQVRAYADALELWVQNLGQAEPVAEANIQLIGADNKPLAEGATDQHGHLRLARSWTEHDRPALLIARKGNHTSLVRLAAPALDLSAYAVSGRPFRPQELFLYGPRDLYRPGDTLVISGLLRDHRGQPLPASPLPARLISPEGQTQLALRWQPQAGGYYELSQPLPSNAALGEWQWQVSLPDGSEAHYRFKVEAFLPERMRLDLSLPERLRSPERPTASLSGAYLYGATASGNRVAGQLWQRHEPHPFEAFSAFHFGNPDENGLEQHLTLAETRLDAEGRGQLSLPDSWQAPQSPVRLNLYASLFEQGGRPVSRRVSGLVLPDARLLGIRPLFRDDHSPADGLARFELMLTDGEQLLAADALELSLVREQQNYFWSWDEEQGWRRDFSTRSYPAYRETLALKADAPIEVAVPVEWGRYYLELRDPAHPQRTSRYRFYAGWGDEAQQSGPEQLQLELDRTRYRPGDSARVRIKAPVPGQGFLLVEGEQPLFWQPITLTETEAEFTLPIGLDWDRQDLYLSVVLVQPGNKQDQELPRRMLGLTPLPLERAQRALAVTIEAPTAARPNSTLNTRVQVRDANGAVPEQAWVTLAAVDVGVLNITAMATPDPFAWFFAQRRYSPELRDSFDALIKADQGSRARLKFGGDGDLSRGGQEPVSDVQIVSLFSGQLALNADGEALVPLELPDFNGELRLMALAFDPSRFGQAERSLTVAAPLVTQLSKPRFLAAGDTTELLLELDNRSGRAQELELSFALGAGLTSLDQGEPRQHRQQSLSLAAGEKTALHLPVQAREQSTTTAVDLALHITGLIDGDERTQPLERHWQMGIRPAWAAETRKLRRVLAADEHLKLDDQPALFAGLLDDTLLAELELSAQPPLALGDHLRALKAYPYGCAEQTTSGVFAQLYLNPEKLKRLGLEGSDEPSRIRAITTAIERLQGMQRSDGSFGLWRHDSPAEPWLTAYLGDFLLRARAQGHAVPEALLARTLDRLQYYLRQGTPIRRYYRTDSEADDLGIRAYAAQVLARVNRAPLGQLNRLYLEHQDSPQGLALVQLGLALGQQGNPELGQQAIEQGLARLTGPAPALQSGDYGSALRDRALALFWLQEALELPQALKTRSLDLVALLGDQLHQRHWFSTQERNALALAALSLQTATDLPPLQAEVRLAGAPLSVTGSSLRRRIEGAASQHLTLHNQGTTPLYLDFSLQGRGPAPVASDDAGLAVRRRYFDLEGAPLDALDSLNSGDTVLVELEVRRRDDEALAHLLLVDLLPAGLELENQNLDTGLDLNEIRIDGEPLDQLWYQAEPRHQEFRDDRYVAALDLGWRSSARVFYLARAVSPGRFRIPPPYAEDMYRPWIRFQGGDSGWLEVKPR